MVVEEKQNPLGYEKISTLIRKMAIPAIVANVVNALYNIVDQIFIGQGVGYLGNAATNIAFPITTLCMAIGLMVGVGAASNFNLALGRKEDKHAREVSGTAVVLLVTAGLIIMSVVLLFLQPLLNLFGATDQILGYASEYAGITALGIPFFMISIGCRFDDRLTGNPKTFAKNAKVAHIDIDPAEIGKVIAVDIPVVGDAKRLCSDY